MRCIICKKRIWPWQYKGHISAINREHKSIYRLPCHSKCDIENEKSIEMALDDFMRLNKDFTLRVDNLCGTCKYDSRKGCKIKEYPVRYGDVVICERYIAKNHAVDEIIRI